VPFFSLLWVGDILEKKDGQQLQEKTRALQRIRRWKLTRGIEKSEIAGDSLVGNRN